MIKKYLTVLLVTGGTILIDQVTKLMIVTSVSRYRSIEVVQDFFHIIHVRNPGIAFGLLKNIPDEYRIMSLVSVTALALLLILYLVSQVKKNHRLELWSLALILGGAVGNLTDRIRLGEVVDFIDLHWRAAYHWPAFNIADAAISVGITGIVLLEIGNLKSTRRAASAAAPAENTAPEHPVVDETN